MLFLARRPIPGRNTRGTFAICAASLPRRPFATSVQSAFASRHSPEKNTKSRATPGRIGSRRWINRSPYGAGHFNEKAFENGGEFFTRMEVFPDYKHTRRGWKYFEVARF